MGKVGIVAILGLGSSYTKEVYKNALKSTIFGIIAAITHVS